jgi:hypothetical protein
MEVFYICTTGDMAHIDTIFKFLPHTRQHWCIDIPYCCNDPCLKARIVSYRCVPCHPWYTHRTPLVVKKIFSSFPVAVHNSIKLVPLVFLLWMFVITENIMKRSVLITEESRMLSECKWGVEKKQSKVPCHVSRRYTSTVLSRVGKRYRSMRAWYTSPDSSTGCPEFWTFDGDLLRKIQKNGRKVRKYLRWHSSVVHLLLLRC